MLQSMRVIGGSKLSGVIKISGAKNLALPALTASILTDNPLILENVPNLADIRSMLDLLRYMGCDISQEPHSVSVCSSDISSFKAPYDFVRKMRASILTLGPLVGRFGKAVVSLPGGCAIGARGVDLHLKALESMGASITLEDGYIYADVRDKLIGCDINLPIATVTGTENIMMAACLAAGETKIINAAMEPEIFEFGEMLNQMGAEISGHGTSVITIQGVESLHGAKYKIASDRIEAGTYAIAAAVTGGSVFLDGCCYDHLSNFFALLRNAGVKCDITDGGVIVSGEDRSIIGVDMQTAPYPGFPTDLQAQFMTMMTVCEGTSSITENIFENRFMHVPELIRMGANINVHGRMAVVNGVKKLSGANVMATDLRASVSLVIAGLVAQGETIVNRLYHLDRGYENLDAKLSNCGAQIERISA